MSEAENNNNEDKPEIKGSDGKTKINHGTSNDMIKIVAILIIVGMFAYQEYQLDSQKKTIDSLTAEIAQMNRTTISIVNAINNQQIFDQNVKQWSDLVNAHILNIYNKTGVSRP